MSNSPQMYAPDYLRSQKDKNLHNIADMIEEQIKTIQAERAKVKELEKLLGLKNDEYIRQVGEWKIIQRLEEERDQLRTQNAEIRRMAEKLAEALDDLESEVRLSGAESTHLDLAINQAETVLAEFQALGGK